MKEAGADAVIYNNGTLEETEKQLEYNSRRMGILNLKLYSEKYKDY